ncbi:MAG: DUF3347 domain-containing protein [Sphingobacteriales bacterium]|nr:MAG: DUF3347 domain-containing protein [Sphingobacteriales bacterium]
MKILTSLNILFVAGSFAFASCGNDTKTSENSTETTTQTTDEKQVAEDREDVYDEYEHLKDALVKNDMDMAKKAVENMKVQLDKVETTKLTAEEITAWNTEAKKMRDNLDKMQASTNIEEMRTYFSPLSDAMYANVKKYGLADETIYYQHCPMAFDNKGASWLSETEEISNPYFGDKMLRCGETKETIEAKK